MTFVNLAAFILLGIIIGLITLRSLLDSLELSKGGWVSMLYLIATSLISLWAGSLLGLV
jgi:hypothetical protein